MAEHFIMENMLVSNERGEDNSIVFYIILQNGRLYPVVAFPDTNTLNLFAEKLGEICAFFSSPNQTRTVDWSKIDRLKKDYRFRPRIDQK